MLLLGVVPTFADDGAKNVLEERIALQALQMERMNAQMLAREAELRVERVKNAATILELNARLKAVESAIVPVQASEQRRRTTSDCQQAEGLKDPHLHFAHGGRADFRGRDGCVRAMCIRNDPRSPYSRSLRCAPQGDVQLPLCAGLCGQHQDRGLRANHCRAWPSGAGPQPRFAPQDSSFTIHDGALTVDGSFITEVHVVAETGREAGELVHAAFRANELNAYNTGKNMITGFCGKRPFFLGAGKTRSCGNLVVQAKHSSATFTTPEWQATVRGNYVYGHLAGPWHRLDVSLRAVGDAKLALGQTHGALSAALIRLRRTVLVIPRLRRRLNPPRTPHRARRRARGTELLDARASQWHFPIRGTRPQCRY